jgi:carboxymethylenebutenolidase
MQKLAACLATLALSLAFATCSPSGAATPGLVVACSATPAGATPVADAGTVNIDGPDESGCAVSGTLVSYLQVTSTDTSDTRCGASANGACAIDLQGYLYVPEGMSGPLPAIVYNHGSEQLPGAKCSIAEYFVPRGYVVFVPYRRGQGTSTGVFVGDYKAGSQISYLEQEVADVTSAWTFVAGLSVGGVALVDPKRMAIMGHSYGGIMTLLTNTCRLGQLVAIDLCGDSESWGNAGNEAALLAAVDGAQSPIFFAQPQNDVHTDPTAVYSHQAAIDKQMFQAAIYPPVPDAASPEAAHTRFVGDAPEVAQWGTGALDFMHRYGM